MHHAWGAHADASSIVLTCLILLTCVAVASGEPSTLRTLILSNNTGLAGSLQAIQLPSNLQALHIDHTSINGSFDAAWMSRQPAGLSCLLAYNTPGLCGALDSSLPCSLTDFTHGTGLSECDRKRVVGQHVQRQQENCQ